MGGDVSVIVLTVILELCLSPVPIEMKTEAEAAFDSRSDSGGLAKGDAACSSGYGQAGAHLGDRRPSESRVVQDVICRGNLAARMIFLGWCGASPQREGGFSSLEQCSGCRAVMMPG